MTVPRLLLAPADPAVRLDEAQLRLLARDCGLGGEEIDACHLAVGKDFLARLSFLGCAPTLVFEPPAGSRPGTGDFYHLRVRSLPEPVFRADAFTSTPHCPGCRGRLGNWRLWWSSGKPPDPVPCPDCGVRLDPADLNWRRTALVAASFIEIIGIQAGIAVPAPDLLEMLGSGDGRPWRSAFVSDHLPDD